MKHDTPETEPENSPALLLALRGWSRGCAALARREFARSLGHKRFTAADREAFAAACGVARTSVSAVTTVAALVLAAKPAAAEADILRGNVRANPGASGTAQQAAIAAAAKLRQEQAERSRDALARTTRAIQALRIAQDSARASALLAAGGNIADGLAAGGLQVAAGVTPGSAGWLNALGPVQSVTDGRTQVEIVQTDAKAVLTWDSFNVGKNTDVYFNQTAGGSLASQWIALNRIVDTTTSPSQILGSIKAEGQVYIVNPNGIVFHGSSQVNVHTLVASGLDFKGATVAERDANFMLGLAADDNRAHYNLGVDAGSGRAVGDVRVDAGARLVSDSGGALYLFGGNVTNAGTLSADDGQVLLASGERIWIGKNSLYRTGDTFTDNQIDPDLRGIRASVENGGHSENTGLIEAKRGNITVTGKDVTLSGALHTTTTTKANGSILLLAGDTTKPNAITWMWPTEFGSLTLKNGALLAITPDDSAGTAFAAQYRSGRIDLAAKTVTFEENSRVHAPSAVMTVVAKTHSANATAANDTSRIYLDSGAEIDLAGLAGVELAMESNTIRGALRLDELKDSPLLRDSVLRGETIAFDLRHGTTLADMSGHYGLIEYGVDEMMTTGGSLKLDSGTIITREGSNIDLSGGFVRYLDGYIETTRLLGVDGRIYDVTSARNDIAYAGIYDTHRKFETGYDRGMDAGTLILGPQVAPISSEVESLNLTGDGARPYFVALEGGLRASTVAGKYQLDRYTGSNSPVTALTEAARAASLTIGYNLDNKLFGSNIRIGEAAALPAGFTAGTSLDLTGPREIVLPPSLFDGATFGTVKIISGIGGGSLVIDAGVTMNLGAYGSLDFHGANADIQGTILAPGGSVSILADLAKGWQQSSPTGTVDWASLADTDRPAITLGANARIDVAGVWTNERVSGVTPGTPVLNGGSVNLTSAHDLTLAEGAAIRVDGGGRLAADNRLHTGDAGAITLANDRLPESANGFSGALPTTPGGRFDIGGATLSGYALGQGGTLRLGSSRAVVITASGATDTGVTAADTLHLAPEFFREGGFAHYAVAGSRSLIIESGTTVSPLAQSLVASEKLWGLATGAQLVDELSLAVKPVETRLPGSLTLSIGLRDGDGSLLASAKNPSLANGLRGDLVMENGAEILMDPGSSVSLLALGNLFVDGLIRAEGGDIRLATTDINAPVLRVGDHARLLAGGYVRTTLVDGLRVRTVKSGGRVLLDLVDPQGQANRVEIAQGAVLDVGGISGKADLINTGGALVGGPNTYVEREVAGDAGAIVIDGFRSGTIEGDFRAAPGASNALGGTVAITAGNLLTGHRTGILLTESTNPVSTDGTLVVSASTLRHANADTLALETASQLAFDGDIDLGARRALHIAAPVIGIAAGAAPASRITLHAPYVRFHGYPGLGENSVAIPGAPSAPTTLAGTLTVTGDLIDIVQTLDLGGGTLGGFDTSKFISSGDIRLTVGDATTAKVGRLHTAGALSFESAQVYVTSASAPTTSARPGFIVSSARSVAFHSNGAASPVPYSFGETLVVRAPDILQAGVVRAPLGEIRLEASNSLILADGSRTSVALEGLVVPIGSVSNGFVSPFPLVTDTLENLLAVNPSKSVTMQAPTIDIREGSVIDLSGSGDLHAHEFVAGNGGSADILASAGMFAVLPGYVGAGAPVNTRGDLLDVNLKVGDSVRLSGVKGLADGVYTLLPAHYALLEGGFAVKLAGEGFAGTGTASTLADGSQIVGGHRVVPGIGASASAASRFQVMSGETLRQYSAYNEYGYNEFLTDASGKAGIATPDRPMDAGTLVLAATGSLTLDGRGQFGAVDGGRLGRLDIAADKIAVVGDHATGPAGHLALNANELNGFGIGSLLLGGTRTTTADGVTIDTAASQVVIANDSASALVIPDIILVATDSVRLADGAVIRAEGEATGGNAPLLLEGEGALLHASAGDRTDVSRTGAGTSSGVLTLGAGAEVRATGSISLDGTRSVVNATDSIILAPQLSLSSAKVSLGDAPAGTEGLVLDGASLDALSSASDLLIRSYGTIDLYGPVTIGGVDSNGDATLDRLVLDGAGLRGDAASGEAATLVAKNLTLSNTFGTTATGTATGTGALALNTETLTVGAGKFSLDGFDSVRVDTGTLTGSGNGELLVHGDLSVAADTLTSGAGAHTAVTALGDAHFTTGGGRAPAEVVAGGRLALTGASLTVDTAVNLPSGVVEMTATTGDLTLGAHAVVRANGTAHTFHDLEKTTDAGTVRLTANQGSVHLAAGSRTEVSAHTAGGNAGEIEIRAAQGGVTLDGELVGHAGTDAVGGSFTLDTGAPVDFTALNRDLETGDFSGARDIRLRTGDITLAAGETLAAHQVTLRADTGAVTIAGTLRANGTAAQADAGRVEIRSGDGVTVESGARIEASTTFTEKASGFATGSGAITLVAEDGDLAVRAGSTLVATGGKQGGGTVTLEALRDGADIRVTELAADIDARSVELVGRRDYAHTQVGTTQYNAMLADAASWMTGAQAIVTRLATTGVTVKPGIRVTSSGDLTLTADLSLHNARYDGAAGSLEFVAGGNLNVNGSVSDGFSSAATNGALLSGDSWDLAFRAAGDLTLAANKLIRTGTGDIRLDAGRDLVLTNTKSVVYTAGSKVADEAGYLVGSRLGEYPVNGGDLAIRAGRDILAPVTADFITAWQYRYGNASTAAGVSKNQMTVGAQTGWSIVFANFEQGLGALGGGDIAVRAGRNIRDLAVMIPTTGQQTVTAGQSVLSGPVVVRGGGDLAMIAGGDILGGLTYVDRGEANLRADGAMTSHSKSLQRKNITVAATTASNYESRDLHALFALGDTALTLRARAGVEIEGMLDVMLIPSVAGNRTAVNNNRITFFNSYTERTVADVASLSGDIVYLNNPWAGADLARGAASARLIHQQMSVPSTISAGPVITQDLLHLPGTMRFTAHGGDVVVDARFTGNRNAVRLAPSAKGNLEFLAEGSVRSNTPIIMMDVAAEYVRDASAPFTNATQGPNAALVLAASDVLGIATNYGRGKTALHAGDTEPVRVYANTGDIAGIGEDLASRFVLELPKHAEIRAGRDVADVTFNLQNNEGADSVVSAGRDVLRPDIRVTGRGGLLIEAGRDIDLTSTADSGIVSSGAFGNLATTNDISAQRLETSFANTALKDVGSDITLVAGGSRADYAAFAAAYLNPNAPGDSTQNYLPELRAFLKERGITGDDATLLAAFDALPDSARKPFLLDVFLSELKAAGLDVTHPDGPGIAGYERGYEAIRRLFGDRDDAGRVNLFGRRLSTEKGGDIRVVIPHGSLLVDVPANRAENSRGIVTQKGGDLRIMTRDNIALANSRVFTLQGGDILMWTTTGDITAGAGSSTRAVPPALTYLADSDANVLLNAGSLQTGAGIGVLDANRTGSVSSRLDLIAPTGTVDAGDAGIRSVGEINIAAQTILGTANISAGGAVTGVSAAPTVNVAAVAGANNSAAATGNAAPEVASNRSETVAADRVESPSLFTVEVLGYGGGEGEEAEAESAANPA